MIRGRADTWQAMTANPFANIIRQRAAFDSGQSADHVDGGGLAGARIDTFAPPYFQAPEKALLKGSAPPTTLDFTANRLPGEEVNAVGVLKARPADVVVTPKTAETADVSSGLPKRTPTLNFAEFPAIAKYAPDFEGSGYDMSMKPLPDGSMMRTQNYTAADFRSCRMSGKDDGTSNAVVSDRYGRPQVKEDIDAQGGHTLTLYGYNDGQKISPFPSTMDQKFPNGSTASIVMDRGKEISRTNHSDKFA